MAKRILVGQKVAERLSEAVRGLRLEYCKISESQLAEEIIAEFFAKAQTKTIGKIAAKYFDEKRYLRSLLSSSTDSGELSAVVGKLMDVSKHQSGIHTKKSIKRLEIDKKENP